ncbi:retrovirus-related Pol polyprotein from transposon 297 [Trichonephila clavipes]|uniref:Retrovirus-related Pol polyprotein from transposon 297 n=1 Tax=Trichonephila clavipes TaxID=2585209 RepID=A0A8X6RE29_TRICX|nr:retrovirus-related Pol polyprotein from transposon 297 [Trichonephila clavipes]
MLEAETIQRMEWTACSPDLNPIEHVWDMLGRRIAAKLEGTRGSNRYADNSRPRREFNRFESQGVVDNQRFDGRRRGGQSDHRFHNQGFRQGGSSNSTFKGEIRPIQSPYASPVVLSLKNNGLSPVSPEVYRFTIDYRKLNAITKYPRYPIPVIDDLIKKHYAYRSDVHIGFKKWFIFQLAISPKDIEKTAFITRNVTFAFLRMPFGLSGAVPNFQKAIDIILKPVFGRFVSVYMDDVIIASPSFNEHLDNLNQVFTLLRDVGLTLNKDKCHFARDK